jgi:predicted ATPase
VVCFVTGEAGSGKTTLVSEFTKRAMATHQDLVVAVGQSDAQTGAGDPYLPFREVLAQLTGDVDAILAQGTISEENTGRLRKLLAYSGQAIVELGPDLIGIFVPGAGLATRAAAFLAEKAGWLENIEKLTKRPSSVDEAAESGLQQSYIFEQYTNVLNKLSEKSPLLLILDDLQWADAASIGLLFRIGRRIAGNRIIVVGTYRPEEVALGRLGERHPLEKVLAEFKRYFGDIWINLDSIQESEGMHFLEEFLDSEPNRLGRDFRQALFHHTHGHALFTVELLRDLQERGDLIQDPTGSWMEGRILDWNDLPDRVEGVIEGRIGRLALELQHSLTVGSVQGENFTAEVVARVQDADERGLIRQFSGELEKQHRLIRARRVEHIGGQRLSLYRFQHNLFQKYLYGKLDRVERSYLHEDVGNVLEDLYGEQADEIAVQLARHFEDAGLNEKAVHYLRLAGDEAAVKFANDEAVGYYSRAINLNPDDNLGVRCDLLLRREKIYDLLGDRDAQSQDLAEMEAILEALGDDHWVVKVILRRANYAFVTDDYPAAASAGEVGVKLAEKIQDPENEATGCRIWGSAMLKLGDSETAGKKYERALQIHRQMGDLRGEAVILKDLGTIADNYADYPLAKSYDSQSLELARQVGDRMTECRTLNNLGLVAQREGDIPLAKSYYEQGLSIMKQIGYRKAEGILIQNIGVLYAEKGEYIPALDYFEQARRISQEVGDRYSEARLLTNMGCAAAEQGDFLRAQSYFECGLRLWRELGSPINECNILQDMGSFFVDLGNFTYAKSLFDEALEIAREIETSHHESSLLNSLGDIANALGEYDKARDLNQRALEMKRAIGGPAGEAAVLSSLGSGALRYGDWDTAKDYFESSLRISREIEERRNEGHSLAKLGLLSLHLGEGRTALSYLEAAIDIALAVNDRVGQAYALTTQGQVFAKMDRIDESDMAFQKAISIRHELGQRHLEMESLAGLAQLSLKLKDLSNAESLVQQILDYLDENTLDGVEDRFQIYLTCYEVLDASGDQRAKAFLSDAYRLLQKQASDIADDSHRESFLMNVPSNRKIALEFEGLKG